MRTLKWTTDKPIVRGFYLWRSNNSVSLLSVGKVNGELNVLLPTGIDPKSLASSITSIPLRMFIGGEWAGPIEEPEE